MMNPIPSSMYNVALILLLSFLLGMSSAQLSEDFYEKSCPKALFIIKSGVRSAVRAEPRMGASLLRLHFHDCFVNAILLDDTPTFTGEKTAGPNIGSIRGFDVIDDIKTQIEKYCPGVVSCADILAVAGRDSTVALDGPSWKVLLGRRDSITASFSDANRDLPAPNSNLNQLISAYSNKGFSAREMVALSGSHTIGQARCVNFRDRIYNDTNINAPFARSLQENCPRSQGDDNLAPLDVATPTRFDNRYFKNLQSQKGLLHSDQVLFNGGSTDSIVNTYSSNPLTFASDFANAMGCDASILLDSTSSIDSEKNSLANANSARGFEVIDQIKSAVDKVCNGPVVSCADILAVAARDSVLALGGPSWTVQLGRRDSTTASRTDADNNLPSPFMDLKALIDNFSKQGLDVKDLVALSGGHTLGLAQCRTFRDRIYDDTNIDQGFAAQRQATCPRVGGNSTLAPLDPSPGYFDTRYFSNLVMNKGLLHSDQVLFNGGQTDNLVNTYSRSISAFATGFAQSMIKMGNIKPVTGNNGQIRVNCRNVN
nr:cationic peroxidase 1-like [Ipomoea batatas]